MPQLQAVNLIGKYPPEEAPVALPQGSWSLEQVAQQRWGHHSFDSVGNLKKLANSEVKLQEPESRTWNNSEFQRETNQSMMIFESFWRFRE